MGVGGGAHGDTALQAGGRVRGALLNTIRGNDPRPALHTELDSCVIELLMVYPRGVVSTEASA